MNILYVEGGSNVTAAKVKLWLSVGFTQIAVRTGFWTSENTIQRFSNDAELEAVFKLITENGCDALAWVTSQTDYGEEIQLYTDLWRQVAYDSLIDFLNRHPYCRGFADDVEHANMNYTTYSDLVTYIKEAKAVVNAKGKLFKESSFVIWLEAMYQADNKIPSTIRADTLMLMMYGTTYTEAIFKRHVAETKNFLQCPYLFIVHSDTQGQQGYFPLADSLRWLTEAGYKGYIGLFWDVQNSMDSTQWDLIKNWISQNAPPVNYNQIVPAPQPNNLISLESDQWRTDYPEWIQLPNPAFGVEWDPTVMVNYKPTFKIQAVLNGNTGADFGGVAGVPIQIKPKDHIVYSAWIKTGIASEPIDVDYALAGGRIGLDIGDWNGLHGNGSFGISDPKGLGITTEISNTFVKFGSSTFQKRKIDFRVKEEYRSNQINENTFTPDFMIPWFQNHSAMAGTREQGFAWFGQPELYINPPLPNPNPQPAPSGSISVHGYPYGGYYLLPTSMVRVLWKARQKLIRPEVHRKLHPLV